MYYLWGKKNLWWSRWPKASGGARGQGSKSEQITSSTIQRKAAGIPWNVFANQSLAYQAGGCHHLLPYLAVCDMDLEGDRLPVQLHPFGEDQLWAVLILTDEPLTWSQDDKNQTFEIESLVINLADKTQIFQNWTVNILKTARFVNGWTCHLPVHTFTKWQMCQNQKINLIESEPPCEKSDCQRRLAHSSTSSNHHPEEDNAFSSHSHC